MTKAELETLSEHWQNKSESALERYQETGTQRYYREYCNAGDLADALKMAANAADAHADNIHTKAQLANFAYKAWLIEHTEEAEKAKKAKELLAELISYGVAKGVIRNDE